jgi:hydrogen peroxide-dependent heme synthase
MSDALVFASYPVFRLNPNRRDEAPRDVATKEVVELFDSFKDRVSVRGAYSTVGFDARSDLMFWLVSDSADHISELLTGFRRTSIGRSLIPEASFLGIVRPAEFAKDHLPAFVQGKEPLRYMTVYPFVRTPEWYLLDPDERGGYLREHGTAGREFPDINANTTAAFGLGDYEWILCFEATTPDRIVDLIRRLRATEARRFTKLEIPFYTGIRQDLEQLITELP